jgi:hypothetical protein
LCRIQRFRREGGLFLAGLPPQLLAGVLGRLLAAPHHQQSSLNRFAFGGADPSRTFSVAARAQGSRFSQHIQTFSILVKQR